MGAFKFFKMTVIFNFSEYFLIYMNVINYFILYEFID